jgi:hypothetical protein
VPFELRRRMRAQIPFLTVLGLLGVAAVLLLAGTGHWRRGSAVIALAFLLAGGMRLGLSHRRAGLLAVRARWMDASCYLVLGVAVLVLDLRLHG